MTEPAIFDRSPLKRWRILSAALSLPLLALAAVLAWPALFNSSEPLSMRWRLALAFTALAGAGLCMLHTLALWSSATRTLAARRAVLNLLPADASVPMAADDADLFVKIGERLAAQIANLENERDGLRAILASMSEGILVVDAKRRMLFANPASRKILGIPEQAHFPELLARLIHEPELVANLENSIVAGQACSFEFQLPAAEASNRRSIQAYCAPCRLEKHGLPGALAVLHDITELRRLERMRTEFVADVSHELRTPLTSLLGYLETLQEDALEDKEQVREFIATCHRQAENLSRIVEDLLRLSRLENPQSEIAETQVALNEVVDSAIEQCASISIKRGVNLRFDIPDTDVQNFRRPGIAWSKPLETLIENAINYNRENGSVNVRLVPARGTQAKSSRIDSDEIEDAEWEIAVVDTGIGIPPHALPRVFERFYRVDKARSRGQGGTGLGLAIVKHIALAHGASIHVESEVGRGSTFFIRFKSAKAQSGRMLAEAHAEVLK